MMIDGAFAPFAPVHPPMGETPCPFPSTMRVVNDYLDAVAFCRLGALVARVEGKEGNDPAVSIMAREAIRRFVDNVPNKQCVRWPDTMEWITRLSAGRELGPWTERQNDGSDITIYVRDNILHRDPKCGPALERVHGEKHACQYHVGGQLHRPYQDGPAMTYTHYENFDLSGEEYFDRGKWHRPSELGPAVTHWARTGEPVMLLYFEHGDLHRDPARGPAWWHVHDARTNKDVERAFTEQRYCVHGRLHRDPKEGPAILRRDNATGVLIAEEFWCHGYMHRDDGPSLIHRTPEGVVTHEIYGRGEHYRDTREGPSMIWYDEQGRRTAEAWYSRDDHQRDASEGPGHVEYDPATGVVREQFFIGGEHRLASRGPAAVIRDRDGHLLHEEFWDGERMHFKYPEPVTGGRAHG